MVFVFEIREGKFDCLAALDCTFFFEVVSPIDGEDGIRPGEVVVVGYLKPILGLVDPALEVDQWLGRHWAVRFVVHLTGPDQEHYPQDEYNVENDFLDVHNLTGPPFSPFG